MTAENTTYPILLEMYRIIQHNTGKLPRACFNQLVRFLADCVRVHPLPREERGVAAQLLPLAKPFVEAYYEDPQDHLARLFAEKECANHTLGQIMTPRAVARYMARNAIGVLQEEEKEQAPIRLLDPCLGTGIFLVEAARLYPRQYLLFYGVELDLDLYRAALVNMRLAAFGRPYFLLRANSLIVDVGADSPNWRLANGWNPPDWETAMTTESGETWRAENERAPGNPSVPQQTVEPQTDPDDDDRQPRLL